MRKPKTLAPCGRETVEGCVQQLSAERGESQNFRSAITPLPREAIEYSCSYLRLLISQDFIH